MKKSIIGLLVVFFTAITLCSCGKTTPRRDIHFIPSSITLKVGESKVLKINDIDDRFELKFSSTKPAVATVDGSGKVIAVAEGECSIDCHVICPCKKEIDIHCLVTVTKE